MLLGHDSVELWRKRGHDRDGDGIWERQGILAGVSLQVEGLQGIEHTVRSDAKTRYAAESDATLYLWHNEPVRQGDRVKDVYDGTTYLVNSDPIRHTYPSGQVAGYKCFLDRVEKW